MSSLSAPPTDSELLRRGLGFDVGHLTQGQRHPNPTPGPDPRPNLGLRTLHPPEFIAQEISHRHSRASGEHPNLASAPISGQGAVAVPSEVRVAVAIAKAKQQMALSKGQTAPPLLAPPTTNSSSAAGMAIIIIPRGRRWGQGQGQG